MVELVVESSSSLFFESEKERSSLSISDCSCWLGFCLSLSLSIVPLPLSPYFSRSVSLSLDGRMNHPPLFVSVPCLFSHLFVINERGDVIAIWHFLVILSPSLFLLCSLSFSSLLPIIHKSSPEKQAPFHSLLGEIENQPAQPLPAHAQFARLVAAEFRRAG